MRKRCATGAGTPTLSSAARSAWQALAVWVSAKKSSGRMPRAQPSAMRSASVVVLAAPALASISRVWALAVCTASCCGVGVMRLAVNCGLGDMAIYRQEVG